jgi:4-oxalocrotonate tautomerase
MPIVIVEMQEGITTDQKRQLGRDLTDAFLKIGMKADAVQVIIRETPSNCWINAGNLCSDFAVPPGA